MSLGVLLLLIVPLAIIQIGLILFALKDLMNPGRRVRGGNKLVWAAVILLFDLFGPLIYLLVGREES